jgi:hypothetical protein
MNRLTSLALLSLVLFLSLWGYCHFGHSHPVPGPGGSAFGPASVTEDPGLDVTQITAIIGSILSAIVTLITGVRDLIGMFRKKTDETVPVPGGPTGLPPVS